MWPHIMPDQEPSQIKTMFSFGAGTILTQINLADLSFCADKHTGLILLATVSL